MGKHECFGSHAARLLQQVVLWLALSVAVTGCGDSESDNPQNAAGSDGSGGTGVDTGGATSAGGGSGGSSARAGTGGNETAGSAGQGASGVSGQAGDGNAGAAAGGPTAITGVFSYEPNPCFTDPCLPGMAAFVTVGTDRYVLRVQGRMPSYESDWQNWDGYVPQEGETVTVLGYLTPAQDIYGSTVLVFEVVQISAV